MKIKFIDVGRIINVPSKGLKRRLKRLLVQGAPANAYTKSGMLYLSMTAESPHRKHTGNQSRLAKRSLRERRQYGDKVFKKTQYAMKNLPSYTLREFVPKDVPKMPENP